MLHIRICIQLPPSAGNADSRSSSFVTPPQTLDGNLGMPKKITKH